MNLLDSSFWALLYKEFKQVFKNRAFIILLTIPPTIQIIVYGFVLSPEVSNLKLGVVDYANVTESRELIQVMTSNSLFNLSANLTSEKELTRLVEEGKLNVGVIIPPEFPRQLTNNQATLQIFIDGVNANSAGLAQSYLRQIIQQYNLQLQNQNTLPVSPQVVFLYNKGLTSSWFFVPGAIGLILNTITMIVASITVVREKDMGTWEQLLMTPSTGWQILLAKIMPLTLVLLGNLLLALTISRLLFDLPIRGNIFLFFALSALYIMVIISLGFLLATISNSQQQVVLMSFFVNQPMVQMAGVLSPIEAMPSFFQFLSLFNPLSYYTTISRGILLRGVGLNALWPHALALLAFLAIFLSLAVKRILSKQ
ncbi:ABC transporter permease [Gloeocapsa sp. PCC 73106]|uniref:ABC transporter permease n=1 Tax=Gloeocapsa sp. PCC 73106 TaxID=102232 RepID=UPI0002ABC360|nr:ABC transporter permease [Gloeocapsa sp. PCC 73106]ELR97020.1 ABC-type multidrug transport system, permease component [Gloeocapsa sp. PCC 73106]